MEIKVICIGKIKNKNLLNLINEYQTRIKRFCRISIIELPETKIVNENKNDQINAALKKEGIKLVNYSKNGFNILLDVKADLLSSLEFTKVINQNFVNSKNINFFIGSSHGVDEQIKKTFDLKISFSRLTFNHQLFRLILLEQIYRSFSLLKNTKYHK